MTTELRLRILRGRELQRFHTLEPGKSYTVGADPGADVLLNSPHVGPDALRLTVVPKGVLLEAKAAVVVEKRRTRKGLLRHGAQVYVGDCVLVVEDFRGPFNPQHCYRVTLEVPSPVPGELPRRVELPPGRTVIGRDATKADLVLPDEFVSSRHAEVLVQPGEVLLTDLGSANGLRRGEEKERQFALRDGDTIQLSADSRFTAEVLPPLQMPPQDRAGMGYLAVAVLGASVAVLAAFLGTQATTSTVDREAAPSAFKKARAEAEDGKFEAARKELALIWDAEIWDQGKGLPKRTKPEHDVLLAAPIFSAGPEEARQRNADAVRSLSRQLTLWSTTQAALSNDLASYAGALEDRAAEELSAEAESIRNHLRSVAQGENFHPVLRAVAGMRLGVVVQESIRQQVAEVEERYAEHQKLADGSEFLQETLLEANDPRPSKDAIVAWKTRVEDALESPIPWRLWRSNLPSAWAGLPPDLAKAMPRHADPSPRNVAQDIGEGRLSAVAADLEKLYEAHHQLRRGSRLELAEEERSKSLTDVEKTLEAIPNRTAWERGGVNALADYKQVLEMRLKDENNRKKLEQEFRDLVNGKKFQSAIDFYQKEKAILDKNPENERTLAAAQESIRQRDELRAEYLAIGDRVAALGQELEKADSAEALEDIANRIDALPKDNQNIADRLLTEYGDENPPDLRQASNLSSLLISTDDSESDAPVTLADIERGLGASAEALQTIAKDLKSLQDAKDRALKARLGYNIFLEYRFSITTLFPEAEQAPPAILPGIKGAREIYTQVFQASNTSPAQKACLAHRILEFNRVRTLREDFRAGEDFLKEWSGLETKLKETIQQQVRVNKITKQERASFFESEEARILLESLVKLSPMPPLEEGGNDDKIKPLTGRDSEVSDELVWFIKSAQETPGAPRELLSEIVECEEYLDRLQ